MRRAERKGERERGRAPKGSLPGRRFHKNVNNSTGTCAEKIIKITILKIRSKYKVLQLHHSQMHEAVLAGRAQGRSRCAGSAVKAQVHQPSAGQGRHLARNRITASPPSHPHHFLPTFKFSSHCYSLSTKGLFSYEPETRSKRVIFHFYYKKTTSFKGKWWHRTRDGGMTRNPYPPPDSCGSLFS